MVANDAMSMPALTRPEIIRLEVARQLAAIAAVVIVLWMVGGGFLSLAFYLLCFIAIWTLSALWVQ